MSDQKIEEATDLGSTTIRKASGTLAVPARVFLEREVLRLTESALLAYREAAECRADGDDHGAELLTYAARESFELCAEFVGHIELLP